MAHSFDRGVRIWYRSLSAAVAQSLPSEAPPPSCLDQTIKDELGAELRPRGVQKRNFLKDGKLALVARGGLYGGDLTSSGWLAGGALELFLTEDLGFELSFDLTPISLDLDEPLAEFFGDDRFEPGMGYLALANVIWSPIHAKAKMGGGIVHADVLLFAGAGRLFHDSIQGVSFDAGLALDLFVSRFVTVRLDARNLLAVQEVAAETRLTNNLIATAGLVVWIPTGLF
ncbi:MAG: outer membrane beta-barrel domain-containing protein [Myxococcales bacterium]|nr:outer membrane beta-barrel domain-containing protein [Myxococcales bacterium]